MRAACQLKPFMNRRCKVPLALGTGGVGVVTRSPSHSHSPKTVRARSTVTGSPSSHLVAVSAFLAQDWVEDTIYTRRYRYIYISIYIGARSGDVLVHVCVRASVADLGKMCGWPELGSVPLTNHTCSFAPPPSPNPAASPTLSIQQFLSSCQSCAKGHPCQVSTMKQRSAA